MFKRIIIVSTIIMNSSFASHVIMSKHVTSGNVSPEDSFVKNCTFTKNAHVMISVKKDNRPTNTRTHHIYGSRVTEINILVQKAHRGRIIEIGASCDGGNNLLYGFINGHKVILDENIDCARHRFNQSSSTSRLKAIALENCGF